MNANDKVTVLGWKNTDATMTVVEVLSDRVIRLADAKGKTRLAFRNWKGGELTDAYNLGTHKVVAAV